MHPSRILFWLSVIFLAVVFVVSPRFSSREEYLRSRAEEARAREERFETIYHLRDQFLEAVNSVIYQPVGALVGGILVGARSQIPPAVSEDFRRTGLSHITAVSGYNITIIAASLMGIFVWFMSRQKAFWLVVALLAVFMVLTGLQASVIRATIMGFFALFAQYVGRLPTPLHALVMAAAIMVAINPMILRFDVGFQLSVLATLGILYLAPKLEDRLPWTRKLGPFGEAAIMTVSAQIFVLPLIVYYFKSISLIALPVNIIVLPMIPGLMFLGFFAGALAWVPLLGSTIGFAAWTLGKIMLLVVHWFAGISWASLSL